MKNLKKVFVMMMVLAMTLSGCGNSKETSNSKKDDTAEATATPTVEATTSPVTEEATTAETKTAQLYVSLDGNALPDKTYDYTGDLTAEVLGKGLSELTGLYFDFKSEKNGKDIIIDWSMEDGLLSDGDPQKMGNFFGAVWPEYGTQQWFMMDSLWYTLTNNLDVENVYFTMDGGQELRIEGILSDTDTFPSDVPYMGSGFYMAHDDVKGDSDNDSSLEAWNSVSGTYGREDSDQFNNGRLQMKQVSEGCFLFEFNLMKGSETDETKELTLAFILTVGEDGVGRYESLPDEEPMTIEFYLSEDGNQVTVTHTGEFYISPDGVYQFSDDWMDVSVFAGVEVLKCLPPALTSLNSYNEPYTFNYYDELVDDLYYHVEVMNADTNTIFAEFLIATDLSKIYRADDGMESEVIFDAEHPFF